MFTLDTLVRMDRQTLALVGINERQAPESFPIVQLIRDKIHRPAFVGSGCCFRIGNAALADFLAFALVPQIQAFLFVDPVDPLMVNFPALTF